MRRLRLASALLLAAFAALPASRAQAPQTDPLVAAERALAAGRPEQALAVLKPFLKREPKSARGLLARSTANCQLGEVESCKKDLEQALKLDPNLRQGWLNRSGIAIAEKRYDDALADLAAAEKLDPAAADNAINQGAVLLLQGKLEPASARFQAHLDANPRSGAAYYLVSTNFALAGYSALAVQHLARAIELDERFRVRARTDANFADLASNKPFSDLMTTDSFRPAPGSHVATRAYARPFRGASSVLLTASLNILQLERAAFAADAEVTDEWALVWSDFRLKVAKSGADQTILELSAPPEAFSPQAWDLRTRRFFEAVDLELLKLEKRAPLP
jgi:tetratricopeptide (TPR) repeat protein